MLVQDQILGEIDALRKRMGLSLILISHDIGAGGDLLPLAVMYAGEIVELAPTETIFERACHPYTQALLAALPTVTGQRRLLQAIPGEAASDGGHCRLPFRATLSQGTGGLPYNPAATRRHVIRSRGAVSLSRSDYAVMSIPCSLSQTWPNTTRSEQAGSTPCAGGHRRRCGLSTPNLQIGAGEIVAAPRRVWLGQDDNRKAHHVAGAAEWRFRALKVPSIDLRGPAATAYRRRVQMIFQNPYEALDPRYTILEAVMEPLAIHGIGNARDRRLAAKQMLEKVDLRPTEHFANRYPLIGGQLQRVAIARALVLGPRLVVADEPVSMLDVSVRAGVMNLMLTLSRGLGLASLYITHDLAVARAMSSRIAVMYLGAIVEGYRNARRAICASLHGCSWLPFPSPARRGDVPHPPSRRSRLVDGGACRLSFPAPRCPRPAAVPHYAAAQGDVGGTHWSACHFAHEVAG